jgi:hypothetical protein
MKRWLSPWVLPLVMLGVVVLLTRPVAGTIWIAVSVLVVRLLNGRFDPPPEDEESLRRYLDSLKRSYFGARAERYFRTPS